MARGGWARVLVRFGRASFPHSAVLSRGVCVSLFRSLWTINFLLSINLSVFFLGGWGGVDGFPNIAVPSGFETFG